MFSKHDYSRPGKKCVCGIIPPHIIDAIIANGSDEERAAALATQQIDQQLRIEREAVAGLELSNDMEVGPPHRNRRISTTNNGTTLPGTLVRSEGQGASDDVAINEAYDGLGATFDLYNDIYGRNSIDDHGMDLIASVHYSSRFNNAFWNGSQMVFGDGDGTIFNRFTIPIDFMGHELTHGVTGATARLEYHDQPGALNESISDVFGSLVKQRFLNQTATQGDWLIGAGVLAAGINGVALRSMKAPGTAYDDPKLGKDPQPDHMSRYDKRTSDSGGVHINSGIPNKAFYLVATRLGGRAWDGAGKIWYRTLLDTRLIPTAQFVDFANLTALNAETLFGAAAKQVVVQAWHEVGIELATSGWHPWFRVSGGAAALGSPITVLARNRNHLDLFVTGTDSRIYSTWWDANGGWANWFNVSGGAAALGSPITVVARNPNHLDLFVTGTDGRIYSTWWDANGGWANWFNVSGGRAALGSRVEVVSRNPNHLDLFVTGTDGGIYSTWWDANGGWASWFRVSRGAAALGSPITALARNPNHLDLFVTGTDGGIYSTWWDANGGWASWFRVSGGAAALGSPITAVARNPNHLDLFVTGTDGRIYSTWWDANGGWANWFNVSGGAAALRSRINAVARNPNHLDLFVTGTDSRIYSTWWDANGGWANWFNVSGGAAALGAPIDAIARYPNHLDLFVTGTDRGIYSTWWD